MANTVLERPRVRLVADTRERAPDLLGEMSETIERVERDSLVWSISTDLVKMLAVFDADDRAEFWREFHQAVDQPGDALETMLREWWITSRALNDPLRREILLAEASGEDDYIEVSRPQ